MLYYSQDLNCFSSENRNSSPQTYSLPLASEPLVFMEVSGKKKRALSLLPSKPRSFFLSFALFFSTVADQILELADPKINLFIPPVTKSIT